MLDDLAWDEAVLAHCEWLRPFLAVPEAAAVPLAMTPPPPDAVGSYGAAAVAWIEASQRIKLRWWQALAITRQLEHREDGSLCHRVVLESAPRRAGKSVRVRGIALWRMAHPDLFGEVQTVVHTGSDVAICREIQRGAWRWSEEVAGWTVSRSNGKEAVETPTGDRWLVRAQQAVYGYDVAFGIVDEGWNVSPDTVSEGLEPATLERLSPQLHLTSTAHRRATSLMKARLRTALDGGDENTLLLLWAAPNDADPSDPAVWRAASPHWSEDRRRLIADKYAKAVAGKADPQADDPDPMAGFTAQYLNIWPLTPVAEPAIDHDAWAACLDPAPIEDRSRVALCFDVAPSLKHASLYAATVLADGRVRVDAVHAWSGQGCVDTAVRELPSWVARVRPRALGWLPSGPGAAAGAQLAERRTPGALWPPRGVTVAEIRGELTQVCMGFASLVDAGNVAHSGDPLLDEAVEGTEKVARGDAWFFSRKGNGDADPLYAAAGAAFLAQTLPVSSGRMRVIGPKM